VDLIQVKREAVDWIQMLLGRMEWRILVYEVIGWKFLVQIGDVIFFYMESSP
jgi:hypothetical protein